MMNRIIPKTMQEARELVYNILNQGDSRYNNTEDEISLSFSLIKQIISLEEREIPKIQKPKEEELDCIGRVQNNEKYIAKTILKQHGFQNNNISFERTFLQLRPDVFAEKNDKIILVECCSCSVMKILEYLSEAEEVWIITKGEFPWETSLINEKMQLFAFKRGPNWNKILELNKIKFKELKQIKSPLDDLE